MRYEIIMLLSWLVQEGYIASLKTEKPPRREWGESTTIKKYFEFVEPQKCGVGVSKKLKLSGNGSKN